VIAVAAGTYAYVATVQGKPSGKTTVTVTHNADGSIAIAEDGAGSFQGMAGTAKATLSLGPDAAPTAYASHVEAAGTTLDYSVTFSGSTATVNGGLGGGSTFTLAAGEHFAVVDGGLLSGFVALPMEAAAWPGAQLQGIAAIYGREAPLTLDAAAKPARPAGVPAADVSLSFSAPIGIVEWYDPTTMVLDELDVPSQAFAVARSR
jgi:hypothetical protein